MIEPQDLTEEEKQYLDSLSPEFKERTNKKFKKLTITDDFKYGTNFCFHWNST